MYVFPSGTSSTVARLSQEEITEKLSEISEFLTQYKGARKRDQPIPLTLLLDLAEDPNPRVRWRAIEALGVLAKPEKTLNTMIAALQDPNSIVRWNAALALGEIGDPLATLPLLDALEDDSKDVQEMANWALVELGEKAVPPLLRALTHQDWWIRKKVARLLGQIGDERATEPLIQALNDPRERIRETAAEALGQIRGAHAVNGLIRALKDEYGYTRQNAMEALIKKGPDAVKPLIKALKHRNKAVRAIVCQALGEIGDPRAIEPLNQVKRRDPEFKVRRSAAKSLKTLRPKPA